jgi:hypothetical protein
MQTKISFDAGLRHHTDMIGQSFSRINGLESVTTNMSSSLKVLQRGHDLTTQRINELEKSLNGGPTSKCLQVELDRINMAVNENAGLLDHLLVHLDTTQNARGRGRLCERRRGRRRGAREGACTGTATMPHPWTLRLILNCFGCL